MFKYVISKPLEILFNISFSAGVRARPVQSTEGRLGLGLRKIRVRIRVSLGTGKVNTVTPRL